MQRRNFLAAVGTASAVGIAGCGAIQSETTLSEPTLNEDSPQRRHIEWLSDDESVGELGIDGSRSSGIIDLSTEINHREDTTVESIRLRVWMPETDSAAKVAVVSPVEGDSSPPPALALYTPDRAPGTVIEITDLDDLKDETISTLNLMVRPATETATTLKFDSTIELAGGGMLSSDYTLTGQLQLDFPARGNP